MRCCTADDQAAALHRARAVLKRCTRETGLVRWGVGGTHPAAAAAGADPLRQQAAHAPAAAPWQRSPAAAPHCLPARRRRGPGLPARWLALLVAAAAGDRCGAEAWPAASSLNAAAGCVGREGRGPCWGKTAKPAPAAAAALPPPRMSPGAAPAAASGLVDVGPCAATAGCRTGQLVALLRQQPHHQRCSRWGGRSSCPPFARAAEAAHPAAGCLCPTPFQDAFQPAIKSSAPEQTSRGKQALERRAMPMRLRASEGDAAVTAASEGRCRSDGGNLLRPRTDA